MFDWVGSLKVREQDSLRVVLCLSGATRWIGLASLTIGLWALWSFWDRSIYLLGIPMALLVLGTVLMTLRRRLVFDRSAGTLILKQGFLGIGTESSIPLFHLRAVVVLAKSSTMSGDTRSHYVAYVERRVGEPIFLDESRRCARLLEMAELIADVAELRLEYDAGAPSSVA